MGYIENLQAQAQQAAKAKAWDDMQRSTEMEGLARDAYTKGSADRMAELNALMQEARMQQVRDPRMYDAPNIPADYEQGAPAIQGSPIAQPTPDLRTSNETAMPAPEQGLAAMVGR